MKMTYLVQFCCTRVGGGRCGQVVRQVSHECSCMHTLCHRHLLLGSQAILTASQTHLAGSWTCSAVSRTNFGWVTDRVCLGLQTDLA